MAADDGELFLGERARLEEDGVGDADLSDVVQHRGHPELVAGPRVDPPPRSQSGRIAAHPCDVGAGFLSAEGQGADQSLHRLLLGKLRSGLDLGQPRERRAQC